MSTRDPEAAVASVQGSTCTQDHPWLPQFVASALQREEDRRATLKQANADKSAEIKAAIRSAADKRFAGRAGEIIPRREWTGALWQWLGIRYQHFGLERRPCKRVIRKALNEWTPPIGHSRYVG